jgi:hypothetical protein
MVWSVNAANTAASGNSHGILCCCVPDLLLVRVYTAACRHGNRSRPGLHGVRSVLSPGCLLVTGTTAVFDDRAKQLRYRGAQEWRPSNA